MNNISDNIRIHVLHTGRVCVSPGLPFKDTVKNPNPMQLTLLTSYGRRRVWLPVSAYLIEHPQGHILFDTGWGRELSPDGCYERIAQIRHMGFLHFLINQGVLPMGESVPEQLEKMGLHPSDLDYVILSHLHTDHASGLQGVREAKRILASEDEIEDTRKHGVRYAKGMWKGISFTPFAFQQTGAGPVGESYDLFGDGSIKLIRMPGHTAGLAAMKITRGDHYVLFFADGGYAEKSWKEMIPPGTALDNEAAMKSLAWIREMAMSPNCVEALANHDPDVIPHEILL